VLQSVRKEETSRLEKAVEDHSGGHHTKRTLEHFDLSQAGCDSCTRDTPNPLK
jgi:hypothetical protein